jgi:uncharacterized protein YutE (UPF0331/DUF86 family)
MKEKTCQLCGRIVSRLTKHHLVPQKYRRRGDMHLTIDVCADCARMIHAMFKLSELKSKYNNFQRLRNSGRLRKYLRWVKDKPEGIVKHPKRAWRGGKYE